MLQPRLFLMRRRPTIELAGGAVLRGASRAVRHAELPSLSPLLRDMEEYLVSTRSRGIASPQLGVPLRLFMISSQCDGRAPDGRTLAVLNPSEDLGLSGAPCSFHSESQPGGTYARE